MAKLLDRIATLPNKNLLHLCGWHEVAQGALTRDEMIQALQQKLSAPEYWVGAVGRLPRTHKLTLRAFSLTASYYVRTSALNKLLNTSHEKYAAELERSGFLFGRAMADEAWAAVTQDWAQELRGRGPRRPDRVLAADPAGPGMLRNLFAVLAMGFRRELPLTQTGEIHKRAMDELLKRTEGCPFLSGDGPKTVALHYAIHQQLLSPGPYGNGKGGLTAGARARHWATWPWSTIWADMAHYVLNGTYVFLPGRQPLMRMLADLPRDAWLPVRHWLDDVVALTDDNRAELESYLLMLAAAGLLDLGESPDTHLFRPSAALAALLDGREPPMPKPETAFVVQPTYEVIAPKTVAPAVLYRLECLGGNRKADKVLQYTLSPAPLRVAVENGDSAAEIQAFFAQHAKPSLAQNVAFSLREWTAGTASARFASVILLRVSDAAVAAQLSVDKIVREHVLGQLTPTDLIVRPDGVEKVRKRLAALNIATKAGMEQIGAEPEPAPAAADRPTPGPDPITPAEFPRVWRRAERKDRQ